MGCKASKLEDQPLVNLCKERKEVIRTAANHRGCLATAHIAYFTQLRHVGDSLSRFVGEDLILSSPSKTTSSSSSVSHNLNDDAELQSAASHFHCSTSSSDYNHTHDDHHHTHLDIDDEQHDHGGTYQTVNKDPFTHPGISFVYSNPSFENNNYANPHFPPYSHYSFENNNYGSNASYTTYYMKKSSTRIPSVIYEEPEDNPIYTFSDYYPSKHQHQHQHKQQWPPPTPPSPKVSAWDYFNPFETFEGSVYPGSIYSKGGYGYGSNTSSPDSREVREREGIPELEEEETEREVIKEPHNDDKKNKTVQFEDLSIDNGNNNKNKNSDLGQIHDEQKVEPELIEQVEGRDSPETVTSIFTSSDEGSMRKKGVSFDGGRVGSSHIDVESSKPSSLTSMSIHGSRDLGEVVREIKGEFEAATDYGKEVSLLLDVVKEPYKSRKTFLKVMLASLCSASLSSFHTPSSLAVEYVVDPDNFETRGLTSTLEKLYAWEKKLYKEVKDEERLRIMYEKQCKKLKTLDDRGYEDSKIEATQASIRKLLIKINISVRAVNSISNRIHKLRDEELQPQLKELIYGLRRMWKLMLKCHHKQFQAVLESRTRPLKASTALRRDSSMTATIQLEMELLKWCQCFNNWIEMQRSYAETLNNWLIKCLHYEPEITPDGEVPYSPTRVGAPPVFVICHDWKQAMERISVSDVQTAMNDFARNLHRLRDRQDDEQQHRLKSENVYRDFEKQIRAIRMEMLRKGHGYDDILSNKNSLSMVASENGISAVDDLRVDLDSMRQRAKDERRGNREAVKLVQAGLIPIFEALESFTSEASKAFDNVRLEHVSGCS